MACDRPCCRGNQSEVLVVRDMSDYKSTIRSHPDLAHTEWIFVKDVHKLTGWIPDHVIVTQWATDHEMYVSYPNGMYYAINKIIAYGSRYTCLAS